MAILLSGIGAARGYGAGYAVLKASPKLEFTKTAIIDVYAEVKKFRAARAQYDARLKTLANNAKIVGAGTAEIFKAYRHIMRDEFFKAALKRVADEKINIEYVIDDERKKLAATFESIDDMYIRERAADVENICNELIRIMLGVSNDFPAKMSGKQDVILVADDLAPAEAVRLDSGVLRGIIMERGGIMSHTVLIAKSRGIPTAVGVKNALELIKDGDYLQIDAVRGEIEINPDDASKASFDEEKQRYESKRALFTSAEPLPSVTVDGFKVDVCVNSGDLSNLKSFDSERCDGVGLLRTEFIYMGASDFPDEETQFEIYKDIAVRANGKDVMIRTLDIGGDKQASYMDLPREANPALGVRAIRLCLSRKDIFAVQLRAILRASSYGSVKLMFPLIVGTEELEEAKSCLEIEKKRLRDTNIPFREDIQVGVMIETPAAVMLSDKLAENCDFFSIGTNDLIQYVTASDRLNERTQWLYDGCNVSVLRSIMLVAENSEKAGIPWSICGEAAADTRLVPLWVAMGVNKLSVASSQVGEIKHLINGLNRADFIPAIEKVLNFDKVAAVKSYLDSTISSFGLNIIN